MSLIHPDIHALDQEDPVLKRTANQLGQSWEEWRGSRSGSPYRIVLEAVLPRHARLTVVFPGRTQGR